MQHNVKIQQSIVESVPILRYEQVLLYLGSAKQFIADLLLAVSTTLVIIGLTAT